MNPILTFIQTGLLMHVITTRVANVWFGGDMGYQRDPLYWALADAIELDEQEKFGGSKDTFAFALSRADQFIKWATLGTEYAWIKAELGNRKDRGY